ncbi:MAG: hypothetical protein OHK0011_22210 [Turneriella sp.]
MLLAAFPGQTVFCAVIYFAFMSAELVYLYRTAPQNGEGEVARINLLVNGGAAVGLYVGEKLLFRWVSLTTILYGILLLQALVWYLWWRHLRSASGEPVKAGSHPGFTAFSVQSALAGFLLFAGVLLAERILRIYLTDTADIVAEIQVFSLSAAALVSFLWAKIASSASDLFRHKAFPGIFRLLHACSALLFLFLLTSIDLLIQIPRELLLLLSLFPLIVITTSTYLHALGSVQRAAVGGLIAANLAGSLCGALSFGFYALPQFGLRSSMMLFALLVMVWLLLRALPSRQNVQLGFLHFTAKISALLGAGFVGYLLLSGDWLNRQLNGLVERVAPGEAIVARAETPQDIWLLTAKGRGEQTLHHRLIRSSHSMSGSLYPSRRYMKLMAYLGALYSSQMKTALNIGYGTGLTAQALTELPLEKIDVVDITNKIVELASLLHEREKNPDPIRDQRVQYHLGGARYFLQNAPARYDIITGEPPPPSNSSIAYLYTKEFYALVRDHLSTGGVFTYWLPTHSVTDRSAAAIWETFCSVFVFCDLYAGTESNLIMVGYTEEQQVPLEERLHLLSRTRFKRDTGLSEREVFSLLLKVRSANTEPVNMAELLSDDWAYIEEDFPAHKQRLWGLSSLPFYEQKTLLLKLVRRRFHFSADAQPVLRAALIYSADIVFDPYRALRTLEALQRGGVTFELALWLLGEDPGLLSAEAFNEYNAGEPGQRLRYGLASALSKNHLQNARALVIAALEHSPDDEYIFALRMLIEKLSGKDANAVRQTAIAFAQKAPRISEGFARYAGL